MIRRKGKDKTKRRARGWRKTTTMTTHAVNADGGGRSAAPFSFRRAALSTPSARRTWTRAARSILLIGASGGGFPQWLVVVMVVGGGNGGGQWCGDGWWFGCGVAVAMGVFICVAAVLKVASAMATVMTAPMATSPVEITS